MPAYGAAMPIDAARTLAAMTPDRSPHPVRRRLTHLPAGLLACGAVLVVGAAVGAFTGGVTALLGVAFGVLLVAASFTVSSAIIAWADSIDPRMMLPVGLITYALKFTVLGIGLMAALQSNWRGFPAMTVGVAVATFAWVVAHALWVWRARIAYVEIDNRG